MKFEGNNELPSLTFDEATGHLKIWGASIAMEPKDFWSPLLAKMVEYLEVPKDIHLELAFDYFNTPSARKILELLRLIDTRMGETKRNFLVTWHDDGDEDMREAGEDYESMINKNTTWRFK
jgi:hypothetical protein